MTTLTSRMALALVVATLGATALTPAFAQPMPPAPPGAPAPQMEQAPGHHGFRERGEHQPRFRGQARQRGGAMPVGLMAFSCAPRATEMMEVGLVRLSYQLDLTDTQRPLFDDLREVALTQQTTLSDACAELMPQRAGDGAAPARPDITQRVQARIDIGTAQLAAWQALQPVLTTFYDSLTDEQKTAMEPGQRRGDMQRGEMRRGEMQRRMPAPMAPATPQEAPAAPATPAPGA